MHKTIFIHGTLPPESLLTIAPVYTFFKCPRGLTSVNNLSTKFHHRQLAEILFRHDSERFSPDAFYFYGWSGKLCMYEREIEAEKLFHALKDIQGPLRIVSYSHGGNIALRLAQIAQREGRDDFVIDELVLLACPVQRETKNYITSKIFNRVVSIHSHRDMVQVLDPQGLYELAGIYKQAGLQKVFTYLQKMQTLFSGRHFPVAHNLIQVNPQINGRNLWHIEFILPSFIKCLPKILDIIEQEGHEAKKDDWVMKFKV